MSESPIIQETRLWLERAVIGLNLCPFAKAAHQKKQIRWVESAARDEEALVAELVSELERLAEADPALIDTTLLVHPQVLHDFDDFNDFMGVAEAVLEELELDGEIQIASFHPQFRFEGTEPDDLGNYTNRSPHPTLHLLREASIERALEAVPEAADIYERNIATLEALGLEGWHRVMGGDGSPVK
jgi:uncharacterized protein